MSSVSPKTVRPRTGRYVSAFAVVVGLLVEQAGAQQAPAQDRTSYISAGLGAQAPDFDRSVFEVGFKGSRWRDAYRLAVNLRFGRYSAADVLGRERAASDGFTAGARPLYASMFYGLQGPIPKLRAKGTYVRASVGLTSYLGQSGASGSDLDSTQPIREIGPRFAPGMEFAVGISKPSGSLRPWSEIRVGGEYMSRTGFDFVSPVIAIGIDLTAP